MVKSFSLLVFGSLLLQFFLTGNCIFIKMDERIPHCFRKKVSSNEHLTINYVITGDGESEVKMEVIFIYFYFKLLF